MKTKPYRVRYAEVVPFTTKDGSEIRELLAYRNAVLQKQSLAEARLRPGQATARHYHKRTEEIYYIVQGRGVMELGRKRFAVAAGDAIGILPNTTHKIRNTGKRDLVILCCCAPAYENADTVLLEKP